MPISRCRLRNPRGLTLTNEGNVRTDSLYFAVDYIALPSLPVELGRFHAQYRQAAPCKGWTDDWTNNWDRPVGDRKNLSGEGNYVFLEATGKGHFVGVTHAVLQNQDGWFGEGDDMIFIDGDARPPSMAPAPRTTTTGPGILAASLLPIRITARLTSWIRSGSAAATASIAGTSKAPSHLRSRSR